MKVYAVVLAAGKGTRMKSDAPKVVQGIVNHGKSPPSVSFCLPVWYHRSETDAICVRADVASRAEKEPGSRLAAVVAVAVRIHPCIPFFKADKTETPVPIGYRSSWWARVDVASRAAKNSPLGCFCAVFCDSAAAVRIHP